MGNVISKGNLLPTQIVEEVFNGVRGESALAKLSAQRPIPFNGVTEMVFNLDHEASIVGENDAKVNGGGTAEAVVIRPIKFEYGMRTSDEFIYGTEEYRLDILRAFAEGAARKFARGLDIAAFHGLNPYNLTAVSDLAQKNFEGKVTNDVTYAAATPDANIASAVALVEAAGAYPNGVAMSPTFKNAIAAMTANNAQKYPEFAWGAAPQTLGDMNLAVNPTVSMAASGATETLHALVGDFSAFRWGYAKEIPLEVIQYGDPDNSGSDLKGHNQVYLRAEAYIGWGILAPAFFAKVTA
jgi:HK97 family phage major capsid protein